MKQLISTNGILLFLIGVMVASAGCGLFSHPSDDVFVKNLRSDQDEFNRLAAMIVEDSDIVRLSDENVFFNDKITRQIPEERLSEYRRLFKKLNIEAGFHRDNVHSFRLIASSQGMATGSSEKSYYYSETQPAPIVDSLDVVIANDRGDHRPVYRKLNGNWYLYYESW